MMKFCKQVLAIAVLIIAGVFLFSRNSQKKSLNSDFDKNKHERTEPVLPSSIESFDNFSAPNEPRVSTESALQGVGDSKHRILVLNILPVGSSGFDGRHLIEALENEGLLYGAYDLFQYASRGDDSVNLFSVANIMEPGSFNLDTLPDTDISGLAVFSVLPVKNLASVDVFAEMLAITRRLAESLGGEVTDDSRSTLTPQTAHHLRESIVAFDAQLGRSR